MISQDQRDLGSYRARWTVSSPESASFACSSRAILNPSSGLYDQEYLDYLRALLQSMQKHGLVAYVVSPQLDPAQFCD
jgi:hypothetical protein